MGIKQQCTIGVMSYGRAIKLHVNFVFYPAEQMTWNHPGSDPEIELVKVVHAGSESDVYDDLTSSEIETIQEKVAEYLDEIAMEERREQAMWDHYA